MSAQPLVLKLAGDDREIKAYTLPPRDRPNAADPERAAGGGVRILGDHLETPTPLVVRAEITGDTLAAAYALAYAVIVDAELATAVTTHEGEQAVRALLGYSMEHLPSSVIVTFRWAPAIADLDELPDPGVLSLTWDAATAPTWDAAAGFTWDAAA